MYKKKIKRQKQSIWFVSGSYDKTSFIYDPVSETWSTGPELSQERFIFCSVALNEEKSRVLVAGGRSNSSNGDVTFLDTAWIYDFDTQTHAQTASMNQARFRMGCAKAKLSGKEVVVVAGGQNDLNVILKTIEVFDIATSAW